MWSTTRSLAAAALLASRSLADIHHIYTSSFTSPDIFLLEFNDAARTLKQLQQIPAHSAHPSMTFSYDKTALYAGEKGGWASYAVSGEYGSYGMTYNSSVPILGQCADQFANYPWGSTAVVSESVGPYVVYGAPLGGCGNALAVTTELNFDYVSQNITYNKPGSAVRGLAMDPDNTVLYSADLGANGIWVHSINAANGLVTNVGFLPAHLPNAGPRKIVVHPGGKYMYVLLERANMVAVYAVNKPDAKGGYPAGPIAFTGLTYSLIPKGENPANYWGADIALSEDGFMLLATTRYKLASLANSWDTVPGQGPYQPPLYQYFSSSSQQLTGGRGFKEKRRVGSGYVMGILLTPNEDGSGDPATYGNRIGPGYPLRLLFQQQTSASGGMANAVSPAPWGNSFFAITDSEYGVVEVWKIDGNDSPDFGGEIGEGALTATVGGWIMGTWAQSAKLTYENQYAKDAPVAPVLNQGGINTTVPRPYVPISYYSTPGKPGATPVPAPAPAPEAVPTPAPQPQPQPQQPYQPYNPQQPYQPYNPSQYQPQPGRQNPNQYQPQPNYQQPGRGQQYQPQPNYQQPGRGQQYQPQPNYQQPGRGQPYQPQPNYRPNQQQQGRPQYQPYQQSRPWSRRSERLAKLARRWMGLQATEEKEKRQITANRPLVTAKVFAAWQAGYVKSIGTQAGCCTNALWFD